MGELDPLAILADVATTHCPGPDGFDDLCWAEHDVNVPWTGQHVAELQVLELRRAGLLPCPHDDETTLRALCDRDATRVCVVCGHTRTETTTDEEPRP